MGEKKQIHISVKDKIACLVDEEQFLVCGNNDYDVVFDFDSDWEGISAKTAVFVYGNTPIHQPFVGNICEGVEIKNSTICAIGVFAGDIKTTTGATIECKTSIRDFGGVPKPPSKEVYDEIMDLLNKAISGGGGGNVDLSEYVKNTDYATSSKGGVVKASKTYGLGVTPSGTLYTEKATNEQIDSRQGGYNPIVPSNLEYSVNSVVGEPINKLSEKQTDLEERVADLESLTLTYTKDSSTAYEKVAPAECGKYAMIKSIGGATEVIGKSKNLINPEKIELYYKTGEDWNVCPYTINADGSITFTVKLEYGIGAIATIRMPNGEAKYYYFAEGNFSLISEFESLQIEFDLPEGEEYGDAFYAPEKTFTLKIMAFIKEGDTESGWEVAPEGTVFEPYVEPHFKHANVERVDTLGKNLAYKQYGIRSLGGTVTEYAPYKAEPLDSLEIPEAVRSKDSYGLGIDSTTYNYLQIVDGKIDYVQTCKEATLTDTQTWTAYGAISTGLYRYSSQLPSDAHIGTVNGLCDRYPTFNGNWNTNKEESVRFGQGNAALYLYLAKELTVSEVQTLMNGVKIVYKLAEPIVTDVTADIITANPDFATKKGKLLIEGGGRTRFVNENEMPVPNTLWYVTRKE